MMEPYTEEDKLSFLLMKSSNFRKLFVEFELELDFTKKPPVRYVTKIKDNESNIQNKG